MTLLARFLAWLFRRSYVHGNPHSVVVVPDWALEGVIAKGWRVRALPGTTLVAVLDDEGRPVREILITLDE